MATTIREFFDRTYFPLKLIGRSDKNVRQYGVQLKHLKRFLGREPLLSDLTDDTISRFLGWFLSLPRAAPTVNKARAHILAVWRLAAEKRLVAEFPAVRALDEPERIPEAWTVDQLRKLFAACRRTPGTIGRVPACLWWLAFHHVIFDTGERTSATLSILWEWVNLDTGWLTIPADVRKGRRKPMAYQLRRETIAALILIRGPMRPEVFPWDRSPGTFWPEYGLLLARADLPTGRLNKPQKMRRSFASHLEAAGGNATEALGHSFRRTTVGSYLDPKITGKENHAAKLPKIEP